MIVTVDLDNKNQLETTLKIAKAYDMQVISIRESPSGNGYHIELYIHKTKLEFLNFLDVPKDIANIVRQRYFDALTKFNDKVSILRYVLGDDENRILFDLSKGDVLPKEVLFYEYKGKRPKKGVSKTDKSVENE